MKTPRVIDITDSDWSGGYNTDTNIIYINIENVKKWAPSYKISYNHIRRHELVHFFQHKKGIYMENLFISILCELEANWIMQRDLAIMDRIRNIPLYIRCSYLSILYKFKKSKYDEIFNEK